MTSSVHLTPLAGINADLAQCHLLQVGETRLLLDCGWDENFSEELLKKLTDHVGTLDAVLLSYPDPYHLGALPYLVGKMGLKCPVYATIPVARMGQLYMYDVLLSRKGQEEFDLFTLDDIDSAFGKVTWMAYNESIKVKGERDTGLTISPLRAGHMVGGAIWKIAKDDDGEIIVYGVDYNHRREKHLDGCSFEGVFRPHLLITDSFVGEGVQNKRISKEEHLGSAISKTLKAGGDVLIPVDVGGRVLEMTYLLEQMWEKDEGLNSYHLIFMSNVAWNVLEFASCMLEWMGEKIVKSFEFYGNNEFSFKHMKVCQNLKDLNNFIGPKVVLASVPDMECGFSRELFVNWCGNPRNSVILTARTSRGTLTRTLIDEPQCKRVTVNMKKRVALEGVELERYKRHKVQSKMEKVKEEREAENETVIKESEEGYGNDYDEWEDNCGCFTYGHDYIVSVPKKREASQLLDNRPMFPFKKRKVCKKNSNPDLGMDYNPNLFAKPEEVKQKIVEVPNIRLCKQDKEEVPTKCESAARSLDIKATILFIDFEGRSDVDYLKNVIAQTKPLQLVLLKANGFSLEYMTSHAMTHMPSRGRVFVPTSNEAIDCTMDSQVISAKMSDALVKSLHLKQVKDYKVAWIDALVSSEREDQNADIEEDVPFLDVLPDEMIKPHDAVLTNNMRMSEFKEALARNGFQAEFHGGVLVVNGEITLRKGELGTLIPEGVFCKEYFTLMEHIEKHFVVL